MASIHVLYNKNGIRVISRRLHCAFQHPNRTDNNPSVISAHTSPSFQTMAMGPVGI